MQHIISIAPMLDWTDRHYRYFMRQLSKHSTLYTEMIIADAIIHGDTKRLLSFDPLELPLIIQLGGSNPDKLAWASKICEDYGYSGINLNVGCPSKRVKSGNFGACLMEEPELVAKCLQAMQNAVNIPVSVKHRTGLGYSYDYTKLAKFIQIITQESDCQEFIVHARNAILGKLSPKENREIPPLHYEYVYQLKQQYPELLIHLNGGIKNITDITTHLSHVDGVMIGREAYHNPFIFNEFDQLFYNKEYTPLITSRLDIANSMLDYLSTHSKQGVPLHHITKHMLGLFHGQANAKLWRHSLSSQLIKTNDISVYIDLLHKMQA